MTKMQNVPRFLNIATPTLEIEYMYMKFYRFVLYIRVYYLRTHEPPLHEYTNDHLINSSALNKVIINLSYH